MTSPPPPLPGPRMRGVVSEAMVMCASAEGMVEIIDPPDGCAPGDRISFEGYTGTADAAPLLPAPLFCYL